MSDVKTVPKGWESRTVEDLVTFSGGAQPPRSTFSFEAEADKIRLIQIRDYKSDKYATYIPRKLARKFCGKDDIMIGRYGPPIFQILRGIEGAYNVALIKASPKKGLGKEYLWYFLNQDSLLKFVEGLSQRTSGQTGIEMDQLKDYSFPLPPLPEQHKIAVILSAWDDALSTLARLIDTKRQQKRALAEQLLTGKRRLKGFEGEWEEKSLEDISSRLSRGKAPSYSELETNILAINQKCVRNSQVNLDFARFQIDDSTVAKSQYLLDGDICINSTGTGTVGRIGFFENQDSDRIYFADTHITVLRTKKDISNPKFLLEILSTYKYQNKIESDCIHGSSNQVELNRNDFAKILVPLPPLPEQQAIAAVLSTLDAELIALTRQQAAVQQQKRGLMDLLLTGRVRVKVDKLQTRP